MNNKILWLGITATLLLLAFSATTLVTRQPAFHGAVINPPVRAAEISMTDQNGQVFRLSGQRGKVVLLTFGFVNCPDECPLTMAHLKQALELSGPASTEVQVVMISTDPARDTPQAMKDFLGNFNPTFVGIPGAPEQLAKIWEGYGVEVLDGGETHSSLTYVIDRKGNLRLTFTPDSAPEEIAADLKTLLAEK